MSDMFSPVFENAKWIWLEDEKNNDLVIFRRKLSLQKRVRSLVMRIAANSHYYLNVNGKFIVWEGGLGYPSGPDFGGYYDEIDIAKYIKKGDNAIVVVCRYNGPQDAEDTGVRPGLLCELVADKNAVICSSDDQFDVYRNEANAEPEKKPNVNFDVYSHCYDATKERQLSDIYLPTFGSNIFSRAKVLGAYRDEPWGELRPRPVPLFYFDKAPVFYKFSKEDKGSSSVTYKVKLPKACFFYPAMIVTALGKEKIRIYSDRHEISGDFGDKLRYESAVVEYICKAQAQNYESFGQLYGQEIVFEIPKSVKVKKLGCRMLEYDSTARAAFKCSDASISGLVPKLINTLEACMGERIISNPERDRALTLDSANIAARAILKTFDEDGVKLVRKTIAEVFGNIIDDNFLSEVPGEELAEIPSAGLLTVSEVGMLAAYSNHYSDMDEYFLSAAVNYLEKWEIGENDLIVPRGGWMDHLFNIDSEVLENALYYSALRFVDDLAAKTKNAEHDDFIKLRMGAIESAFERTYFNGLAYSSKEDYYDDRANAFAVLSGLCKEENYDILSDILVSTQNSSMYMEGFVLEALCYMDKNEYARKRMSARYSNASTNGSKTVGEEFIIGGAETSSRSVMPLTVLLEYFGGVKVHSGGAEISVTPNMGDLREMSFTAATPKGAIRGNYSLNADGKSEYIIDNDSKNEVNVILKCGEQGIKTFKIGRGKSKYTIDL